MRCADDRRAHRSPAQCPAQSRLRDKTPEVDGSQTKPGQREGGVEHYCPTGLQVLPTPWKPSRCSAQQLNGGLGSLFASRSPGEVMTPSNAAQRDDA